MDTRANVRMVVLESLEGCSEDDGEKQEMVLFEIEQSKNTTLVILESFSSFARDYPYVLLTLWTGKLPRPS